MPTSVRLAAACLLAAAAPAALAQPAAAPVPLPALAPTPVQSTAAERAAFRPVRAADAIRVDRNPPATFIITTRNFPPQYTDLLPTIEANLQAAAREWALIMNSTGTITIDLSFAPFASSRSTFAGLVQNHGDFDEYMQGWPFKQQTGTDPDVNAPDIEITLDSSWLDNFLWLDPSPHLRQEPFPFDRVDAVSLFMNMLGSCAFMNGWMNPATGELPPAFRSSFDMDVRWSPERPVFVGPAARAAYANTDIPLTIGRIYGLGNDFGGPGFELRPELLFGPTIFTGVRYEISPLTVALAADSAVLTRPICRADINRSGAVTPQDLFDFLSAWFALAPRGDFNTNLDITPQDLFDFLAAFFTGCP